MRAPGRKVVPREIVQGNASEAGLVPLPRGSNRGTFSNTINANIGQLPFTQGKSDLGKYGLLFFFRRYTYA